MGYFPELAVVKKYTFTECEYNNHTLCKGMSRHRGDLNICDCGCHDDE